jgi:hypothetical protein
VNAERASIAGARALTRRRAGARTTIAASAKFRRQKKQNRKNADEISLFTLSEFFKRDDDARARRRSRDTNGAFSYLC